jgi:hypothetical protein
VLYHFLFISIEFMELVLGKCKIEKLTPQTENIMKIERSRNKNRRKPFFNLEVNERTLALAYVVRVQRPSNFNNLSPMK